MSPYVLNCKSIREAKYRTISLIMGPDGKYRKDQRRERTRFVRNLIITIPGENCELSDDPITARQQIDFGLGVTDDDTAKARGESFIYAYGWELREENALEKTYELLRDEPETRRACLPMFKPRHVSQEDIPCFCTLVFDVDEEYLNLTAFSRSNDTVIAMQSDIYGFSRLLIWMAGRLGLKVGDYCQHVVNAHVRIDSDGDLVKKILAEGY